MVTHMKTTIEIADDLLTRAKRDARREGKTLREIVEDALRLRLSARTPQAAFRLKRHTFHGEGRQPGVTEGDWATVRDLIYRLEQ
jgi:Arc/MetJ family transcription regulator